MSRYVLSKAISDLQNAAARERFTSDPDSYLADYPELDFEEREAVKQSDALDLYNRGVSIYLILRLGHIHGVKLMETVEKFGGPGPQLISSDAREGA